MRTSSAEVFIPHLGGTVRVRAIPPNLLAVFASRARRPQGKIDVNEFQAQKLAYGMVDPNFTMEEARQLLRQYGRSINLVLDAIDRLSGTPDPVAPSHLRRTLRIAAQVSASRNRRPRRGRAPRRASCNSRRRGSVRSAGIRSGQDPGEEGDPDSESPAGFRIPKRCIRQKRSTPVPTPSEIGVGA